MERKRSAILRIESTEISIEEMSEITGRQPDTSRRKGSSTRNPQRPLRTNVWELREDVGQDEYLGLALERLWPRILPAEAGMAQLARRGCILRLALVQWISDADPHEPGFGIGPRELGFLASIGALLDVDQYAASGSTRDL
ncbi:DUF4279 domain-containing protein [Streptomyces ficellus]|uniref:DUF4279 domain-containing protein n=1 Tax=Streptomyces ficellus TaxID=1977088 RepID=A0A6I6FFH8_9ACTN|nr:DUF4279 domain-containing protein [Streptomyces ficellus]QGV77319.1 DUF4279 domain-containing protein [Streptomyces ficellus]